MPEKLKMHSTDLVMSNIEKIAELFPNCVTEAAGENGKIARKIDFDLLRQELSGETVEGPLERYHLNWPGKREAMLAANAPIAKTLRPCQQESVDFENTRNIFIEGDNLEVLKLLQEPYLGKIKMVYIDPPYNRGADVLYRDDYVVPFSKYLKLSNQSDNSENGVARLASNTESNGRFHSDWLSMLYPRLKLCRNLLSDDGVFFASIDDAELPNLVKLCDEVFGRDNFVGILAVENNPKGRKNAKFLSVSHESCVVYARDASHPHSGFTENIPKSTDSLRIDDLGRSFSPGKRVLVGESSNAKVTSFASSKHYTVYYRPGDGDIVLRKEEKVNLVDQNLIDAGFKRYFSCRDGYFIENTYTAEEFLRLHGQQSLTFKESTIYEKDFNTHVRMKSLLVNSKEKDIDVKTETARRYVDSEIAELFPNPKNVCFLRLLISLLPEKDFTVLDFFAGSGTTAHAVAELNARDGGSRRSLSVQIAESCDESSKACQAGFHSIADIAKERIRRSLASLTEEHSRNLQQWDGGLRVFKVDSSNLKSVYYSPAETSQLMLGELVEKIKEGRSGEDLIFQVLLDCGLDLGSQLQRRSIADRQVYFVNDSEHAAPDLIACFDADIPELLVKTIAAKSPLRAVFRDQCFSTDADKINVEQIFKQLSPQTQLRSL